MKTFVHSFKLMSNIVFEKLVDNKIKSIIHEFTTKEGYNIIGS